TRNGNAFTGYLSADGNTWTSLASATVSMASSVNLGLAVCSGSSSTTNLSVFDNVSLTNTVLTGSAPFSSTGTATFGPLTVQNESVDFQVTGDPDLMWQLEESTDAINWTPLQSFRLLGGSIQHSEADTQQPVRLLRLKLNE